MKTLKRIALAICLHAPLTHTNNGQHDQCSLTSYAGCTILMGAGALCAVGAYVAHKAAKQDLCALPSRNRDHANNNELKTFKYFFSLTATGLSGCSLYCLNACLNQR